MPRFFLFRDYQITDWAQLKGTITNHYETRVIDVDLSERVNIKADPIDYVALQRLKSNAKIKESH